MCSRVEIGGAITPILPKGSFTQGQDSPQFCLNSSSKSTDKVSSLMITLTTLGSASVTTAESVPFISPSFLSQFAQYRVVLCGCNRDSQPVRQRDQARISHSYSLGQRACVAARRSHRSRNRNDKDRCARPLAFCSLKMLNRLKLETLLAENRLAA